MATYGVTIPRIQQLPEPLAREVSDFAEFLLIRRDHARWQLWTHFAKTLEIVESDFTDYLSNLRNYEDRLARGEIQWE